MCVCVCACVRACVRACVHARASERVGGGGGRCSECVSGQEFNTVYILVRAR